MNILHVIPDLSAERGGPVTALTELSQKLAALGHQVEIFATSDQASSSQEIRHEGVVVSQFPRAFPKIYDYSPSLELALKNRISGFDLVHIHTLWLYPTWAAGYWARKRGVPYLVRPCGMLDRYCMSQKKLRKRLYLWLLEKLTLRGANAVHFASEYEQAESSGSVSGIHHCIAPLGIHSARYGNLPPAGTFRKNHPETQDKQIILFLGRLHPIKGLELLLQAFHGLHQTRPNTHLVLAGSGENTYGTALETLILKLGLRRSVTLTGFLNHTQKLAAFGDASMFCLPSYHENFGLACLEAMAAGLPVVVSDRVGISDKIVANKAGLRTACSVHEIQRGLQNLIENPKLAHELSRNAKQLVDKQFDWNQAIISILNAYENCLKSDKTCHLI